MKKSLKGLISSAVLLCVSLGVALLAGELFMRWHDGYNLFSVSLRQTKSQEQPKAVVIKSAPDIEVKLANYVNQISVAPGVEKAWFNDEPAQLPNRAVHPDPKLVERHRETPFIHDMEANYVWNYYYLQNRICNAKWNKKARRIRDFFYTEDREVFVFKPNDKSIHPTYRFLLNKTHPDGLVTNEFGFRGHPLTLNKPIKTVRLAFLGSSTTIHSHSTPYSYPELVEYWLNLWAKENSYPYRIEVINAARSGIASPDIAKVLTTEVLPLNPDYVFYYEGSNQFWPKQFYKMKHCEYKNKPKQTFVLHTVEQYSAIAKRYYHMQRTQLLAHSGEELRKPKPEGIAWPKDLDEMNPDIHYPKLPTKLNQILADWDIIRVSTEKSGGQFIPMSFVWLPYEGLKLDLPRHSSIYAYLNQSMWPFTYAWIRRSADFQNRVFKNYAKAYHLDYIDVDAIFPKDPNLFTDAIHNTYPGVRLRAWVVLQQVVNILHKNRLNQENSVKFPTPQGDQPLHYATMKKSDISWLCSS